MAKMSRQHHISTAAYFVSSSLVQSRAPVDDPVSSSSRRAPGDAYNHNYQFDGKLAIVIMVVVFVTLLLALLAYYVRECFGLNVIPTRPPAVDRRTGQKNHEGLDRESIETFPVVAYSAASMAKNCTDCAVCLTDFQEEEKTRLLPKCNHAFHPECIDMWLFSHSTCPLCRISLISESHTLTIYSNYSQGSERQETLVSGVTIAFRGPLSFYSTSHSERITQMSNPDSRERF